jgi:hypothetical protein|tara:strand:+ start:132 stop:410 length:279 start_codon:yes stop_codon:yes gene_type:complete
VPLRKVAGLPRRVPADALSVANHATLRAARLVVVVDVDVLVDSKAAVFIRCRQLQPNKAAHRWLMPSPSGLQDSVLLVLHRVSRITHFIKYP